jgi:superfamily I DNA and/or RNA helicase
MSDAIDRAWLRELDRLTAWLVGRYSYPAEKISIITTYNGQKHLIRDVLAQRCNWNPLFGRPHKVTTVDRFQGQQNDCMCNVGGRVV